MKKLLYLLLALVRAPQQVLSRDMLLDLTKNRPATPFDRSIDIQISRLRHKIEPDHKKPRIIKTVREWVFPGKAKMFEYCKQAVLMAQDAVDVLITLC